MTRPQAARPRAWRAYVAVLSAITIVLLARATVDWSAAGSWHPALGAGSIAVIVIAGMAPLTIVLDKSVYQIFLDSAPLVVLALLAAPGEAVWYFFAGQALCLAFQRRSLLRSIFNVAQCTISAVIALAVLDAIGAAPRTGLREGLTIAVLSVVFFGCSLLFCAVGHYLMYDTPPVAMVLDAVSGVTATIPLLVDTFGYLAVVLIRERPAALVLMLPPVVMVLFSSRAFHKAHSDRVRMRGLVAAADGIHVATTPAEVLAAVVEATKGMLGVELAELSESPPGRADLGIHLPDHPESLDETWLIARGRLSGVPFAPEDEQALQALVKLAATAVANVDLMSEIRHQARHDGLTGLPNRTSLYERLEGLAAETQPSFGVVFVDLDGFKRVNDDFGHHVGDELLQQVADRLRAAVRRSDLVVRLGGDEFCVVLPDVVHAGLAWTIADDLRRSMHAPFEISGNSVTLTASIGIAVAPEDGTDVVALLRAADAGMYAAKRDGKDGVGRGTAVGPPVTGPPAIGRHAGGTSLPVAK